MAAGRVFKNAQDRFIAQLAAAVKIGNARLINFRIKHDNRSVIVNVWPSDARQAAVCEHPAVGQRPGTEQVRLVQGAHLRARVPRRLDLLHGVGARAERPLRCAENADRALIADADRARRRRQDVRDGRQAQAGLLAQLAAGRLFGRLPGSMRPPGRP